MNIINRNGTLFIDSREVGEMTGKDHANLLRDIRGYIDVINNPNSNLKAADFFIESIYIDRQNQERPCFLLTRKGCDMVANKMTGEKGVLFTATYVTRFEEMEKQIQAPMQQLSPQLQLLINMELEQKKLHAAVKETKEEVQAIREVVEIRPSNTWRNDTNKMLKKICYKLNDYQKPKEELYKALQERGACDLKRRLENMRARLILNGGTRSKADKLNFLDVIAEDKKLIEIYTAIVKEMAIKYKVA